MKKNGAPRKHDYNKILEWIVDYKVKHDGNSPTRRELAHMLGNESTGTINNVLVRLEEENKIKIKNRRIYIIGGRYVYGIDA